VSFSWLPLGTEKPLIWAAFSHLEEQTTAVSTSEKTPKKTAVYIDGYNLYYGRLRGTAFKWLDVVQLFETLLAERDQNESLEQVNLFTAHALATFATNGKASVEAQSAYHRALKTQYGDRLEIVYGTHTFDRNGALLPTFSPNQPYDRTKRTRVWKIEEKKTDVNLAIGMYRDACKGLYERIILVSNDSDAEPALEAVRQDFPKIMIGVVMPIHPPAPGTIMHRRASGSLINLADWFVTHLTDQQLREAQLPAKVTTKKKPILKPGHW
jgi:uncharacterized LabA/DUF88 family protein